MANLGESEPQNVTCNVNNRNTSTLGSHFCIQLIFQANSTKKKGSISGKITSGVLGWIALKNLVLRICTETSLKLSILVMVLMFFF